MTFCFCGKIRWSGQLIGGRVLGGATVAERQGSVMIGAKQAYLVTSAEDEWLHLQPQTVNRENKLELRQDCELSKLTPSDYFLLQDCITSPNMPQIDNQVFRHLGHSETFPIWTTYEFSWIEETNCRLGI